MLDKKDKLVFKAIEKNTRLESYDLDTVNYSLIYAIAPALVTGTNVRIDNTIEITEKLRSPIRLYGFSYVLRFQQPFPASQPKIGIAVSKYIIGDALWTSAVNAQYEGMYHIGHHSSFPAQNDVTYNMPRFLNQEDKLFISLFVENDTGANFSSSVQCNITLYYRLAEMRRLTEEF